MSWGTCGYRRRTSSMNCSRTCVAAFAQASFNSLASSQAAVKRGEARRVLGRERSSVQARYIEVAYRGRRRVRRRRGDGGRLLLDFASPGAAELLNIFSHCLRPGMQCRFRQSPCRRSCSQQRRRPLGRAPDGCAHQVLQGRHLGLRSRQSRDLEKRALVVVQA